MYKPFSQFVQLEKCTNAIKMENVFSVSKAEVPFTSSKTQWQHSPDVGDY